VSSTIQPETILRELAELWVSLGKETEPGQSSGVLRACSMTLVATADESEDPSDVWATLAALMPEHPSRAIVIRFRQSPDRALSSRVFSQCWMPFGQRRQICCEQIEIIASDASLPDLPAVIVPLAVADLPVVLWCRGSRLFRLADFPQLAKVAQKLVIDSAAFPSAAEILGQLDASVRPVEALADLAWTRLTRMRELISQIFENRSYLSRLGSVSEVHIAFGGATAPARAYYLAAWLIECLESAGAKPGVIWEPVTTESRGRLLRVELMAPGRDGLRVSIGITGDAGRESAEIRADGLSSRTVFPAENDYALLRKELSIPGRDPVYESSLRLAKRLAAA
jgi:glucose-6-phosphate dehydrogenase assembly protein OpcA